MDGIMSLRNLQLSTGAPEFWETGFRNMLEDHLTWIKEHEGTRVVNIGPGDANKYHGDFNGLLSSLGLRFKYHWITMRLNGYFRPDEYRTEHVQVYIPSEAAIDGLRTRYATNR